MPNTEKLDRRQNSDHDSWQKKKNDPQWFFTQKTIRSDAFHLPALPVWGRFSLNSDPMVTVLPHPQWSTKWRQYWVFLGMSLPSAVRPHHPPKGWSSVYPSDWFMTNKPMDKKGVGGPIESNLTGWSDHKFLTGQVMVSSHTPGT